MSGTDPATDDLEVIGRYLARRDVPSLAPAEIDHRFDVLVLCGSSVLASAQLAADAFHAGVVGRLLITGGIGHSTPYLVRAVQKHPQYADVPTNRRPEAAILSDILQRHHDVPTHAISLETQASNCGQNAEFAVRMLAQSPRRPTVLLVQDPTMQRRTHASFERHGRAVQHAGWLTSFAPVIPAMGVNIELPGTLVPGAAWDLQRFASLALGEIRRLYDDENGYGPRGADYIDHVAVPTDVLSAYHRIRNSAGQNLRTR